MDEKRRKPKRWIERMLKDTGSYYEFLIRKLGFETYLGRGAYDWRSDDWQTFMCIANSFTGSKEKLERVKEQALYAREYMSEFKGITYFKLPAKG